MESTVSVSKGVFVFKNKLKSFKDTGKVPKRGRKKGTALNFNIFNNEPWYRSYLDLWQTMEKKIHKLQTEMSLSIFDDLTHYIANSYDNKNVTEIPTAALLTGVNMPDHEAQFSALIRKMKENPLLHVACLRSEDGQTIKNLIENMMHQFVNGTGYSSEEDDFEDNDIKIKKINYTFAGLKAWYDSERREALFVVIIPDFESFKNKVLHEFILIVSSYLNILPFAFVFGIATSLTVLHKTLPYHVSSKINIQFFNSQTSSAYLNSILENVLFSEDCPFQLGGNIFNLFVDIFLFYDLSVSGFIQKYKYAMLEHFSFGNAMTLCTNYKKLKTILKDFDHESCENARRILSFRKMVEKESPENQIKLLTDDDYFKESLKNEIQNVIRYLHLYHLLLKCLFALTKSLPKQPLGKEIRELYCMASSVNITKTDQYKEAFQLLQFQSKVELMGNITKICEIIEVATTKSTLNRDLLRKVVDDLYDIFENDDETMSVEHNDSFETKMNNLKINSCTDRNKFKNELMELASTRQPLNKFEAQKTKLLTYLSSVFSEHLYEPTKNYFHEIFFFYNSSIEQQIVGTHRTALHTALNDPFQYLQCDCCELRHDSSIEKTMPDICIAYKLHLEYGKMINLYDWLQAFVSVVNPVHLDDAEADQQISPQLQARFTQAVAELEFLGFVKSSKRKADHVQRLTWGG
nr:origin recognition complex subunit 3 [Onthophagus taurus]